MTECGNFSFGNVGVTQVGPLREAQHAPCTRIAASRGMVGSLADDEGSGEYYITTSVLDASACRPSAPSCRVLPLDP